jgi:hypothetical protein
LKLLPAPDAQVLAARLLDDSAFRKMERNRYVADNQINA